MLPVGSTRQTILKPDVTFHLTGTGGWATEGAFQLRLESQILQSSSSIADLLERLRSELHFQVARHARSGLFVHAGVVGWAGRAILIPGRSRTGKTSLVAALARAGADYYSDEYAVVDAEGRIHPYAKPLSVRGDSDVAARHEIADLGFRTGSEPLWAGLIVSTSYQTEAGFRPRHGSPGQGLLHLIDNTIVVRERPRTAMEYLTPVARAAALVEGPRGDSDDTAAYLLQWCADHW